MATAWGVSIHDDLYAYILDQLETHQRLPTIPISSVHRGSEDNFIAGVLRDRIEELKKLLPILGSYTSATLEMHAFVEGARAAYLSPSPINLVDRPPSPEVVLDEQARDTLLKVINLIGGIYDARNILWRRFDFREPFPVPPSASGPDFASFTNALHAELVKKIDESKKDIKLRFIQTRKYEPQFLKFMQMMDGPALSVVVHPGLAMNGVNIIQHFMDRIRQEIRGEKDQRDYMGLQTNCMYHLAVRALVTANLVLMIWDAVCEIIRKG